MNLTNCDGGSGLDIAGNPVSPITTSTGRYLFENLKPGGSYCVQFTRPAGYNCTTPNASGVGYQVNSDGLQNNDVCATGPIPLVSGSDDRSWDLGLVLPPTSCKLTVNKTCEVLTPPTTNWVCSEAKPLNVLTMISKFPSPVKIKAWKGAVGSTLLVTIDNVQPKQEVSVSGYAGAPNDVIWEIFTAGTETKIGQSTFHLSCSDVNMNGPEDCGKAQGDGKAKTGFLNNWILEGLSGNGKTLDCTTTPSFPTAENCTVFPTAPANCATQGKPKELVFKYTVTPLNSLCTISNGQSGKATCSVTGTFAPNQTAAVQAAGNSNLTKDVYTVVPTTVDADGTVTVTFGGKEFKSDSYVRLSQGSNRVDLKIHTSCSQALAVGDVFGPLTLVGFNGATGGTPVRYGYELKNLGNPVKVSSILDDKLGPISSSDCEPGLPNLATNGTVRCTKEGSVTQTTINTVTVNATLDGTTPPQAARPRTAWT